MQVATLKDQGIPVWGPTSLTKTYFVRHFTLLTFPKGFWNMDQQQVG